MIINQLENGWLLLEFPSILRNPYLITKIDFVFSKLILLIKDIKSMNFILLLPYHY